ncbi:MAG: 3-oxoacyl-ACP synthase, partial [Hydrococcus sp. RM1_1_31]|nr:3-oxoacyl-ACP synthase [Hydrococcus sp. RM1_1_31]
MRIWGHGGALPPQIITNEQLAQQVDTSDEWIFSRTGIKERRVITNSPTSLVDLAVEASMEVLTSTTLDPIDL